MAIKKQPNVLPFSSVCFHAKKKTNSGDLPSKKLGYKNFVEEILRFAGESSIFTQFEPLLHFFTYLEQKSINFIKNICLSQVIVFTVH